MDDSIDLRRRRLLRMAERIVKRSIRLRARGVPGDPGLEVLRGRLILVVSAHADLVREIVRRSRSIREDVMVHRKGAGIGR